MTPEFSEAFQTEFETLLNWRRDVRRFKRNPLPDGSIERLLHLADLAPSVGNSQPWRVVVVESDDKRALVTASFEKENHAAEAQYEGERALRYRALKLAGLKEAPVHLAVFNDEKPVQGHGLGRVTMPESLVFSTVGMIHTLWLAARAEGIGLGWVSILDPDVVRNVLEVDAEWRLVAYLCLGYPEEEHQDPELERLRWQARSPLAKRLFRR